MKNENCLNCMYSKHTEVSLLLNDINIDNSEYMVCDHKNSPYFSNIITEDTLCRLFENEQEYFFRKDRKNKIENLNDKSRIN